MSRGHRSWTHDAMTEAPGRKNDAHLSSVPGGEGGAAKIGEVFRRIILERNKMKGWLIDDLYRRTEPLLRIRRPQPQSGRAVWSAER